MDVGPGQLVQRGFVLVIGKGGIENVDDVQLRGSGCHSTAAENGLVGGGLQDLIRHFRYRRIDTPGDGNDGGLVLLHDLHALDHFRGSAGIGDHNAQVPVV